VQCAYDLCWDYYICLWFIFWLLWYTELLLCLPSQFCSKIIYCNKCAYDLCYDYYTFCNYCNTQNRQCNNYTLKIVMILVVRMYSTIYGTHQQQRRTPTETAILIFLTIWFFLALSTSSYPNKITVFFCIDWCTNRDWRETSIPIGGRHIDWQETLIAIGGRHIESLACVGYLLPEIFIPLSRGVYSSASKGKFIGVLG
jgi:hypothetical protein